MRKFLRSLMTVGDHHDHATSRRTVEKEENQPRQMLMDEVEKIIREQHGA